MDTRPMHYCHGNGAAQPGCMLYFLLLYINTEMRELNYYGALHEGVIHSSRKPSETLHQVEDSYLLPLVHFR